MEDLLDDIERVYPNRATNEKVLRDPIVCYQNGLLESTFIFFLDIIDTKFAKTLKKCTSIRT